MKGTPTDFWGKLETDDHDRVVGWHPLTHHAADVAACCEALLNGTRLRHRLARLAHRDDLSERDIARLSVIAALHDVGKFNSGFQRKGFPGTGPGAGHVSEVLALLGDTPFREQDRLLASLPAELDSAWAPDQGAFRLLVAAIGHHGRPIEIQESKFQATHWRSFQGRDPFAGIHNLSQQVRSWFPAAFESGADVLPTEPLFQHAFAGLVMLADWLGSDTRFFRFPRARGDRPYYLFSVLRVRYSFPVAVSR